MTFRFFLVFVDASTSGSKTLCQTVSGHILSLYATMTEEPDILSRRAAEASILRATGLTHKPLQQLAERCKKFCVERSASSKHWIQACTTTFNFSKRGQCARAPPPIITLISRFSGMSLVPNSVNSTLKREYEDTLSRVRIT